MPVTLVLRGLKGIPLTNNEVDTNFTNLKSAIDLYTANDVLLKLNTVDTNTSGLNAQFLIGNSAVTDDQIGNSIVMRSSGGFTAGTITAVSFIGPVTGNITGNVTGNITGNVIGNATGLSTTLAIGSGGTSATTTDAAKISLGIVTSATGSEIIPRGTTLQRDGTPLTGYLRYNTDTNTFEGYTISQTSTFTGTIAVTTGILTLSAIGTGTFALGQSLTGTGVPLGTNVLTLLTGTLGVAASTYSTNIITAVASTLMTGSASTWGSIGGSAAGGGGATGANGDQVFQENSPNVTASYTLSLGKSAGSIGPISILSGVTVTIPASKRWVVF